MHTNPNPPSPSTPPAPPGDPADAPDAPDDPTDGTTVDVLVIGAGLAGLAAARRIAATGASVAVIEARDRVGGRTEGGATADGTPIELGGQWIGPTQHRMYELVAELGLETFPTYNEGHHVVDLAGRRSLLASHRGATPKLSPFALADIAQGLLRFQRIAKSVPLDEPWSAPNARRLDAETFDTWVRRNLRTTVGREYFRLATEAVFSAHTRDLSLLHAAFYVHSGTDLDTLISVDRGAQQDRIVGGSIRFAEALADRLPHGSLHLGAVVRGLRWNDSPHPGVSADCRSGATVHAKRAIVTLPPTLAGRIDYQPALPSWRDQLCQRVPAGSVIKCYCIYPEPFWRADGLTGQAVSDTGPVKVTFDNSPPDGSPGILMGFLEADEGRELARVSLDERRRAVVDCMVRYFGPRAADPIEYLERDWMAEEFSRGCYGAHFTPGVWTSYGHALRTPIGPIHWAGAETADVWNGYMEGAVRSGERAAAEVLAAL